jgi:hypothetical protein
MIDAKLILIEGMTGVGKSTTAQRLWLHLDSLGHAARWVYEHDVAHPIWPAGEQERLVPAGAVDPAFLKELRLRWSKLAGECSATGKITILDGAYFQATIGFLLAMNLSEAAIVEHALAVDAAIAEASPALVYLRRRDIAQGLRATFEDRPGYQDDLLQHVGKTPYAKRTDLSDVAGLVRFYEHWVALLDRIRPALRMNTLVIDTEVADAPPRERQLTDFLGLPQVRDVCGPIREPSRFVGRYRDVSSSEEIAISGTEQGLYLGDGKGTALIPRPGGSFHLAAVGAELTFTQESGGLFHSLRLSGNLPSLSPVWVRVNDSDDMVTTTALEASKG